MGFYKSLTKEIENKKLIKEASTGSKVWEGLKSFAIPSMVGTGLYVGMDQLMRGLDSIGKKRAFKKMVSRHPEILKHGDKLQVLEYFDSLYDLNSDLAKNPSVAASFIKERIDMGMGIPTSIALDLKKVKSNTSKGIRNSLLESSTEPIKKGVLLSMGLEAPKGLKRD